MLLSECCRYEPVARLVGEPVHQDRVVANEMVKGRWKA
jgi:hypothetical protein